MSSVWPGGSSRWARPPASQPPEAAASSAQCRSPRGGSWASWRKGWAMTRRGIRCWPLPRCSRTAAPLPDAHGVRSQPRFFSCRCRCRCCCRCRVVGGADAHHVACCLSLPSLGVLCRRGLCSRVDQAWAALACHARTPAQLTHQEHPRWAHIFEAPEPPALKLKTPNDSHAHGCTQS